MRRLPRLLPPLALVALALPPRAEAFSLQVSAVASLGYTFHAAAHPWGFGMGGDVEVLTGYGNRSPLAALYVQQTWGDPSYRNFAVGLRAGASFGHWGDAGFHVEQLATAADVGLVITAVRTSGALELPGRGLTRQRVDAYIGLEARAYIFATARFGATLRPADAGGPFQTLSLGATIPHLPPVTYDYDLQVDPPPPVETEGGAPSPG